MLYATAPGTETQVSVTFLVVSVTLNETSLDLIVSPTPLSAVMTQKRVPTPGQTPPDGPAAALVNVGVARSAVLPSLNTWGFRSPLHMMTLVRSGVPIAISAKRTKAPTSSRALTPFQSMTFAQPDAPLSPLAAS